MINTQVQFRRGTNAQNGAFAGASGEITVDTTYNRISVHDGNGTLGGFTGALLNDLNSVSGALQSQIGSSTTISGGVFQSGQFNQYFSLLPSISNSILTLSNSPLYINTGLSAGLWKLPLISTCTGRVYQIKNRGFSLLLSGTNNDYIFSQYPSINFTVNSGDAYQVINDGYYWNIC